QRRQVERVAGPHRRTCRDGSLARSGGDTAGVDDLAAGEVGGGDAGDLDVRSAGNPVDEDRGAGRLVAPLEELAIDLVGPPQVLVAVEEHMAHDDIPEVEPGLLQRGLHVAQRLPDLFLERRGMAATRKLVSLARDINDVTGPDRRAEREAR